MRQQSASLHFGVLSKWLPLHTYTPTAPPVAIPMKMVIIHILLNWYWNYLYYTQDLSYQVSKYVRYVTTGICRREHDSTLQKESLWMRTCIRDRHLEKSPKWWLRCKHSATVLLKQTREWVTGSVTVLKNTSWRNKKKIIYGAKYHDTRLTFWYMDNGSWLAAKEPEPRKKHCFITLFRNIEKRTFPVIKLMTWEYIHSYIQCDTRRRYYLTWKTG